MPRGIPRFKKAIAGAQVVPVSLDPPAITGADILEEQYGVREVVTELPRGWAKGALLNVRNTGAEYRVTLHPEEFDPIQPDRCLHFTNPAECQNFISAWYSRESHDPRAR